MSEILLGASVGLLVLSNAFWAWLCLGLVNRLMSRDFYEFKQAKAYKAPKPQKTEGAELVVDPYDEMQAQNMNTLMGIA